MPTSTRPRGRPPMPCAKIDYLSYGRKSSAAKSKLRSTTCAKRSKSTYPPYKCNMTSVGCRATQQKIYTNPFYQFTSLMNPLFSPNRKASSKKASPKKASPKKASPKKASPKKAAPKKAAPKKAAPKKTTSRKRRVSRIIGGGFLSRAGAWASK